MFQVCKTKGVAAGLILKLSGKRGDQLLKHFRLGELKILLC